MNILNIYLVLINAFLFFSCTEKKPITNEKSMNLHQQLFVGDTTISDTIVVGDYLIYNKIGYGEKNYYIHSIKAKDYYMNYKPKEEITYENVVSIMYEKIQFVYDSIICNQIEYKGEKSPTKYNKVFISSIKTSVPVLKDILTNNKHIILSAICIVDTTFPVIEDSLEVFSINDGLKTNNPISFKYIESLRLSSLEIDTANFIHNSDIDTLNISISNLKLLDFKNTRINVLNISYSPNIDIEFLKANELINSIILYDDKNEKFITIK